MTQDPPELLRALREETRTELDLLHQRVNTVLAAEAFLTISYTATMSSTASWARLVAPVLAGLGLVLAVLAWPGVHTTAGLVTTWTRRVGDLLDEHPDLDANRVSGPAGRRRTERNQELSLLLFRCVPPVFAVVWIVLLVVSLTLH